MTPNSSTETILTENFDGMGMATARIQINRRLSEKHIDKQRGGIISLHQKITSFE
jgi:hypothetical protein